MSIELGNAHDIGPVEVMDEKCSGSSNKGIQMLRRMSTRAAFYIGGGYSRQTSQWSITSIKKEFREADIEDIYKLYRLSQHRNILFKLLCILAVYTTGLFAFYLFSGHHVSELSTIFTHYGRQEMVCVYFLTCLVFTLVFGAVVILQRLYAILYKPLTVVVWLYLLVIVYVPMVFMSHHKALDHVTVIFCMIIITHTMLPTSRGVAVAMGAVTMLVSLGLVIAMYLAFEDVAALFTTRRFVERVIADALVYLESNFIGFYLKHFTDIQIRRTFLETTRFINGTIKIERHLSKQDELRTSLLLKIIPKHLVDNRDKLLERLTKDEEQELVLKELMVARHDDVSILFADIVSFTPLTADMEPHELVLTLNELFGRFDELAQKNKCLRIKILGDCYYCVSGLPDPTPSHARNCVVMGMQMIKVIEHIRQETGVEKLNMRIGIHTGWVMSGLLGDQKWQYDAWSDDVTLANHLESGGKPGKVHITEQTLCELHGEFQVEPGFGAERDQYLSKLKVESFFIADSELQHINTDDILEHKQNANMDSPRSLHTEEPVKTVVQIGRRKSIADCIEGWGAEMPFDSLSHYMLEKTILPEKEEVKRKLKNSFDLEEMERHICAKVCSSWNLHAQTPQMSAITLKFTDRTLEQQYCTLQDDSFPFYVTSSFLVFAIMSAVQLTLIRSTIIYVTLAVGLILYATMFVAVTGKHFADYYHVKSSLGHKLSRVSEYITTKNELKICCSLLASGMILLAAFLPVVVHKTKNGGLDVSEVPDQFNTTESATGVLETTNITTPLDEHQDDLPFLYAPYFIFSCFVTLVACQLFLRVSYLFKTLYMTFCFVALNLIFYLAMDEKFENYYYYIGNVGIMSRVLGSFHTALLFVTLMVLERNIESHMRVAFLHITKTKRDKDQLDKNDDMQQKILWNILPRHVGDHFLDPSRSKQQLYHHQYKNACVMFAAIPDFEVFFSNVDVVGADCLRLLNEIISGFDSLLKEHPDVEKIKTIGSTYMAATGLHRLTDTFVDETRAVTNAKAMAEFALAMMSKLDEIGCHAFCNYSLRIGMNHGGVIAGVVGAQKPVYDIWGDAVNVASRMESHGTTGEIQVPKATAELLEKGGIRCCFRTTQQIKGKKLPVDLYFVQSQPAA